MIATGAEMLDKLREHFGSHNAMQEAISKERALTRYRLTYMDAVSVLYKRITQPA